MNIQESLKGAVREYTETGNTTSLVMILAKHPEIICSPSGEYPDVHRIVDISIGGVSYRVCRSISGGEVVFLVPVEHPDDQLPGVPLWLTGEALRQWALDEEGNPAQDPVDWNKYLSVDPEIVCTNSQPGDPETRREPKKTKNDPKKES